VEATNTDGGNNQSVLKSPSGFQIFIVLTLIFDKYLEKSGYYIFMALNEITKNAKMTF